MLANTRLFRTELIVAEEAYLLASPHHPTIEKDFSVV